MTFEKKPVSRTTRHASNETHRKSPESANPKDEFAMFIHAHMQGFDKDGTGISRDTSFYDRYGAPYLDTHGTVPGDGEEEGWEFIEKKIAEYNAFAKKEQRLDFPKVSGYAGAAHLYACHHGVDPWNWTGWVPNYTRGAGGERRKLPALRGNEIQNNLWDYDPYSSEAGTGEYLGGYWYKGEKFARYLHINSLKALQSEDRFNSIVHPLYYPRYTINEGHPNNTLDGMQMAIIDINSEALINANEWGQGCHGIEVFNDFSYFYSYSTPNGDDIGTFNGERTFIDDQIGILYNWIDTYPLEFGTFLLDTALSHGTYLFALAGNDSYYDKNEEPPEIGSRAKGLPDWNPYRENTVFGYTSLIIDQGVIGGDPNMLDEDEARIMKKLRDGMFYSSTGLHHLFNLSDGTLPYRVVGQTDDQLVTQFDDQMELVFDFAKVTELGARVLWMYHLEGYAPDGNDNPDTLVGTRYRQRVTGYFKLKTDFGTRLDLGRSWNRDLLNWIRFEAIDPDNPQKRAWFNPIRGMNFHGQNYPAQAS